MVDTNQCKLAWEGNEEEYEDFYDYGEEAAEGEGQQGERHRERARARLFVGGW